MKQTSLPDLRGVRLCSQTTVFFAVLFTTSMLFSPFLLSVSMWGLLACAFWYGHLQYRQNAPSPAPNRWEVWKSVFVQSFRRLLQNRPYAYLLVLLALPALSGLWSSDTAYWLERTRVRLPFLVLPFVFVNLPPLSPRQFRLVLYILVWVLVVFCIGVGINFLANKEVILQGLSEGRPIPVPRQHIRFSLILCTGIVAGTWLWLQNFVWKYAWERYAFAGALVFLFFFQHFLAVRSGLAALYAVLFFSVIRYMWNSRQWVAGLGVLFVFSMALVAALQLIPSLKQRVDYMVHDWHMFRNEAGQHYSDSERWISLQTGVELWKSSPIFGVGAGDLPQETERVLREQFPQYTETPKLPHNQMVYLLAGTGLFGLLLSMWVLLYPVVVPTFRWFYLFVAHQVVIFMSFLVEYTIETSIGVAFYLFYTLWYMNMAVAEKKA